MKLRAAGIGRANFSQKREREAAICRQSRVFTFATVVSLIVLAATMAAISDS